MKHVIIKHKKSIVLLIMIIIFVAGLLDIKYEGLFYQLLPNSIQSFLGGLFNK